ncbi:MAG: hypothetical protein HUU15_03755 [Candidatus Brocadiae bacterium]|nr:hypothetical protein [Candidatus Brocadiia bacterium]
MKTLACLLLFACAAFAEPAGWHRTLKDGVKAGQRSGKPVLVVTIWKDDQ